MNNICQSLVEKYLDSNRFNGVPMSCFEGRQDEVRELIEQGNIDVVGPGIFSNPHIKPFSTTPRDRQLEEFANRYNDCCLYPGSPLLVEAVNPLDYEDRPYTKRLAMGDGQFDGVFFDLVVLEQYLNDPRYYYWADDINGHVSIKDDHYQSKSFPEKDKVLLETFGFGYNDAGDRCVVSLLWYLSQLSQEHQQIWKAKELITGDFKMHPDYYRNNIVGDWGERLPICEAFIMELAVINRMAMGIKGEPLFRNEYSDGRPKEFSFLIRPTLKAFNSFILLLDQMMSDNLNKTFFRDDIKDEYDFEREDGKVEVRKKGTITMLEEWLNRFFKPHDDGPLKEMMSAFRKVRKLRQKPAHCAQKDVFDQKYIREQRQIIRDAYGAVRTLRLVLANHPKVKMDPPEIHQQLMAGKIWSM